jgi:hypothetical protein
MVCKPALTVRHIGLKYEIFSKISTAVESSDHVNRIFPTIQNELAQTPVIKAMKAINEILPSYCTCSVHPNLTRCNKRLEEVENFEKLTPEQIVRNMKELERSNKIESKNLSKDDMYFLLLKPYKYERLLENDPLTWKMKYTYRCKYNDCNRYFTKGWNILDHVRMHEGLRPYQCEFCERSFTQRCNLKKHRRRHITNLKNRKKFKCNV